jgi:site-specific DNA-methyltransferase (adenine-specific)
MGSGSTAVACINTGRNYLGFELDNTYYEVANKRIEDTNYKNKISIK